MTGMSFRHTRDWINNTLLGGNGSRRSLLIMVEDDARCEERDRPTSTNFDSLDMHGADDNPKDDEVEDE